MAELVEYIHFSNNEQFGVARINNEDKKFYISGIQVEKVYDSQSGKLRSLSKITLVEV